MSQELLYIGFSNYHHYLQLLPAVAILHLLSHSSLQVHGGFTDYLAAMASKLSSASEPTAAGEKERGDTTTERSSGESNRNCLAAVAANCGLLAVGVGGGALLAWWALSFHQSNEQLWMVPVGLVLIGTPVFAWLSIYAPALWQRIELFWTKAAMPQEPPPDLDPER